MDNTQEIVAARRGNPLVIGIGEGENMIASDITAIISRTRKFIILDDNEVAIVRPDEVIVMNEFGDKVEKEVQTVNWDMSAAEKGGYQHFMLKEIMEQPKAVADTVTPRIKNNAVCFEDNGLTDERLRDIENIHIIGCGSALHAGMVGKRVIEAMCRIRCSAEVASEFRYENPIIGKKDMCIVISQSGETADTLAALRESKKRGAKVLGIVNVVGSSIAREADNVMYTWAGPEIAVAKTKAYSAQLIALYLLAMKFGNVRGTVNDTQLQDMIEDLKALPAQVEMLLNNKEKIQRFANRYLAAKDVFFIGRGIDYAISMEGSLKLKEISYIHSEAYAAGELKHGTISLIEEGTLVASVLTQKDLYKKMISNMVEVGTRGAFVLAVTCEDNTEVEKAADYVVYIPETNKYFTNSLAIIPLQLFGYYIAVGRGCDVDKPRNLAKSVTVE